MMVTLVMDIQKHIIYLHCSVHFTPLLNECTFCLLYMWKWKMHKLNWNVLTRFCKNHQNQENLCQCCSIQHFTPVSFLLVSLILNVMSCKLLQTFLILDFSILLILVLCWTHTDKMNFTSNTTYTINDIFPMRCGVVLFRANVHIFGAIFTAYWLIFLNVFWFNTFECWLHLCLCSCLLVSISLVYLRKI